MTPEQFCYWLQGYVEMGGQAPNKEQWDSIRVHLSLVFKKVAPPMLAPIDRAKISPVLTPCIKPDPNGPVC